MSYAGKTGISRPKTGKTKTIERTAMSFSSRFHIYKKWKIKNDWDDRQYDFKWVKCKNWDGMEQDFYSDHFHP
jgi:hypothetical protein